VKTKGEKTEVKNLPERLRKFINEYCDWKLLPIDAVAICREAADEIERLRDCVKILERKLRAAEAAREE
jgi:hypothetical protein